MISNGISQYSDLSVFQSMRGISAFCLAFSSALTTAIISLGAMGLGATGFIDVAAMLVLALFIYLGHRWAMIGAMILWTMEKLLFIVPIFTRNAFAGGAVTQIIWWAIYMHAFYFAFRVEQARRKARIDVATFE